MTQSTGDWVLSCSVQSAVEILDATASCGCPSPRFQVQVMLPDSGWGRIRSRLPGDRMCTSLHAFLLVLNVNHVATLLLCAIATIGPPVLLRRVCAVGRPATAVPASRRRPAVTTRNRTRTR